MLLHPPRAAGLLLLFLQGEELLQGGGQVVQRLPLQILPRPVALLRGDLVHHGLNGVEQPHTAGVLSPVPHPVHQLVNQLVNQCPLKQPEGWVEINLIILFHCKNGLDTTRTLGVPVEEM